MKIVSQQTKQDGDWEDSYQTHFADEVLCPYSTENEIEAQCREKWSQSNLHLIGEGKLHTG